MNSFDNIIREVNEIYSISEHRNRGTLFEVLMQTYFKNDPMWSEKFDRVWLWKDFPERHGQGDLGVDLVARDALTGGYTAIQCKFYNESHVMNKSDIASFFTELGKNLYSEGIIVSTTDKWNSNAEVSIESQSKTITRIDLSQLRNSSLDWSTYSLKNPKKIEQREKKSPKPHQKEAIKATLDGFQESNRGKLIMACGTGKTYTSLKIAEEMAKNQKSESDEMFKVLYLVPSISLLSQTLRGWYADKELSFNTMAVCSDRKVSKNSEDIGAVDIGFPSTTKFEKLLENKYKIENSNDKNDVLAIFSTYQSLDVIIEAQKNGFYEFDLIICDEAHRTTGATLDGEDESSFTKVHSDKHIKAKKRIYQTATPKIYADNAKSKANETSTVIASMDDEDIYGKEFYRLGFGHAVDQGILTDYKVMVLAVDEHFIHGAFQKLLASDDELQFDDVTKIIGCWNGLVKRRNNSDKILGKPMKRAIAFSGTIKDSKKIARLFQETVDTYINRTGNQNEEFLCKVEHVDGTFNSLEKNRLIDWLGETSEDNQCRILSNARCLTEGVDVPNLDAIMFLKPRKSQVDIIQAVGRVMRKAEGKDYGYIILPIGIPSETTAENVLNDNKKYEVVWQVLNALRSHDERFDAIINKLDLNKKKPKNIEVIGVGEPPTEYDPNSEQTEQIELLTEEEFSEIENAIYGKLVKKVGDRKYWEQWSDDVERIAQHHVGRINSLIEDENSKEAIAFKSFIKSLQHNINNAVDKNQAIEMLAQHIITKPIFEALFESYSFVKNNPVSKAMEEILDVLQRQNLEKEQEGLNDFYQSVRVRANGIDNLAGKQKIIVELYNRFFKTGFKATTERLGIVFTPIEVVDFIINSVEELMQKHFGKSLSDEGVHALDPFTGTGTFIVRLLQSGIISKEDLLRKYANELHANEIVLLSYYIAAINIEETYHDIVGGDYAPFEGIVLTDTFESTENQDSFESELFNENNERLKKQQVEPIFVIMGNPPYSIGQSNVNSDMQNQDYPKLSDRIDKTYAKFSKANLKKSLYDSYIKSFRWASDRIGEKGIIGYVTNASFIDSQSTDGLRKCWQEEFNYVYIFNLRGDQRTQGEQSRREGGKIFGSGSRTPIAISILVKDGSDNHQIFYKDIGDYLSREDKLSILESTKSIAKIDWNRITPDENNDWINKRNMQYSSYVSLYDENNIDKSVYLDQVTGVVIARDSWLVGFSKEKVLKNADTMSNNYNNEVIKVTHENSFAKKKEMVNKTESYIKWSVKLFDLLKKNKSLEKAKDENLIQFMHRPFTKKWLYWDEYLNERPSRYRDMHKEMTSTIYIQGQGSKKPFSCIITDKVPNFQLIANGKGFPLFTGSNSFGLVDNISYGFENRIGLNKQDISYYVYALLHHNEYRVNFANDLIKEFPRVPILKNAQSFVDVGRKLSELHLNYEAVDIFGKCTIEKKKDKVSYKVYAMKHPNKNDKTTIIFNSDITIKDIPEEAYGYMVNGKSAIEWIMEQYQVKVDPKSGIKDDPNDFSEDEKYIFNLLLRIINLSIQTVDLVNSLPPLEVEV